MDTRLLSSLNFSHNLPQHLLEHFSNIFRVLRGKSAPFLSLHFLLSPLHLRFSPLIFFFLIDQLFVAFLLFLVLRRTGCKLNVTVLRFCGLIGFSCLFGSGKARESRFARLPIWISDSLSQCMKVDLAMATVQVSPLRSCVLHFVDVVVSCLKDRSGGF
uniref:Transmembrane protein n=1 Tax=Kalanchoe fedtschenkoi TaxID=63787 RepID=A0A7N1A5Q2_KALFE